MAPSKDDAKRAAAMNRLTEMAANTWMVVPVIVGVIVLFILGLHPPGELTSLISRAVTQLGATR